jgi:hypothetical protein
MRFRTSRLLAALTVGNNFFHSGHNGTSNPAVDTTPPGRR